MAPKILNLVALSSLAVLVVGPASVDAALSANVPRVKPISAAAAPVSSAFGTNGSKICAGWSEGNDPSLQYFKTDHVVGLYTWGVDKPSDADALGFDFWPMLWGGTSAQIDAFQTALEQNALGTIILGFNEPNEDGQSNLDPTTAAALWKQYIEPQHDLGYKLCSPAMSTQSNGQQWMTEFMQACAGCHVDYQCVHWYDTSFESLQIYLTEYHNQLGLPILLTEFADQDFNSGTQPTLAEVTALMEQALQFFDDTDWILAACPFGIMRPIDGVDNPILLQSSDGTPNELGIIVIDDSY